MEQEQLHDPSQNVRALAAESSSSEGSNTLAQLLEVARKRPSELVPLVPEISRLLDSASEQAREVSLQSLSLISAVAPATVAFLLPRLHTLLSKDSTETVSDQAIAILTNYGRTSKKAAENVIPILSSAAGRVNARTIKPLVAGLAEMSTKVPEASREIAATIERLQQTLSGNIRSAATKVVENLKGKKD